MLTLGIETSCDETSVAVVRDGREILSNVILSQADHSRFGGVVPEVASRAHLKTIIPIHRQALSEAGIELNRVDLIAATMGPGLVGALLVGLSYAKGLAFALSKPFVAVNHIEGHLAANYLQHADLSQRHLSLIVSGGHTMLVDVARFGEYEILGRTKDDAVGEAFDKVAKLIGLGYPGGEKLDRLAQSGKATFHRFPRALRTGDDYRFSYSGLKTAVALYIGKLTPEQLEKNRADIAASFQEAAVEVLVEKTLRAAEARQIQDIALAGGVAANSRLRSMFNERINTNRHRIFWPRPELCTDNAAMIAAAGYYRFQIQGSSEFITNAVPYLSLSQA